MPKRGDNIHRRKDGRWEGRYKTLDSDNKVKYCSVYGKTYHEVKEKMTEQVSASKPVCNTTKVDIMFSELLTMWFENNKVRQKAGTITKYEYLIHSHIMPDLGEMRLSMITSPIINRYLQQKLVSGRLDGAGGLSPSYVKNIMLIISSALKFASNEDLCSPLKSPLYKPSSKVKEINVLSREEQKKLENCVLHNVDGTKIGILLSLYAGLRKGEVCGLRWEDIDLLNNTIHVRHTVSRVKNTMNNDSATQLILDTPKTKSSQRDVPVCSLLVNILCQYFNNNETDFVISDSNTFVDPRTFDYRFHKLFTECGLPHINYHALRHTFATRCIEAGVDVKSLSEILGHANVSITLNTYVHSNMEQKRIQIEKLSLI